MNKGIYKKIITILFIGFLSTFFEELKANEELIKYEVIALPRDYNFCHDAIKAGMPFELLEISSLKEDQITLRKGKRGFFSGKLAEITKVETINYENIISWKEENFFCWEVPYKKYFIEYSQNGKSNKLYFFSGNKGKSKIFNDRLINFFVENTGLSSGEVRTKIDIKNFKFEKLKKKTKNLEIIESVIKDQAYGGSDCLKVKDAKFPNLFKKYKNISISIINLREELDLPPSKELKPICD